MQGIKNYKFPDELIVVAHSVDRPIHKVARIVPGLAFIVGGFFILLFEIWSYNDDLYLWREGLAYDTKPQFGFVRIFIPVLLISIGLILLLVINYLNHLSRIGAKGDNAISYDPSRDLLLVRRYDLTYEIPFLKITDIDCRRCMFSRGSSTTTELIGGQYVKKTTYWETNIRKIVIRFNNKGNLDVVSVPVESGDNVYSFLKENLEGRKNG